MRKRKIKVKKHPRKKPKGGTTMVQTHERKITQKKKRSPPKACIPKHERERYERGKLKQSYSLEIYNIKTIDLKQRIESVNQQLIKYVKGKIFTPEEFYDLQVEMGKIGEDFATYYYKYRGWEDTEEMRQAFNNILDSWKEINPTIEAFLKATGEYQKLRRPKRLESSEWEKEELESFLDEIAKLIQDDPEEYEFLDLTELKREEEIEKFLKEASEKKKLKQSAATYPRPAFPMAAGGFKREKKVAPKKEEPNNNNDKKRSIN